MPRRKKPATSNKAPAPETPAATEKPNKSQMIRDTAKSLGKKVRPRDVVAKLKEQGVDVTPALVSTVLGKLGYRRKRRGKKASTASPAAAKPTSGLNVAAWWRPRR